MTQASSKAIAVTRLLDSVMRADQARLLAVLAASFGDLSLAEEALQEAALSALSHWSRTGVPASPQGWLLTVARRKAIDQLRKGVREESKANALVMASAELAPAPESEEIPDERLRLILTCCHPAIELKSRVALTLRVVCGLTTAEIARAFLDMEPTMGQRLSRAKAKIAAAGISFDVPERARWPERLQATLMAIYLIFTTGYTSETGGARDLCAEAHYLISLLNDLRPGDPEIEGAMAMFLLIEARRHARTGSDGATVPPCEQDRSLWDQDKITAGRAALACALSRKQPGPFQIKAAIADCHLASTGPDWPQIAALYQALWRYEPTPVVALNAAVALAETGHLSQALELTERLADDLSGYQPWHAARAALLVRSGALVEAAQAYHHAIHNAPTRHDALFLQRQLASCLELMTHTTS